MVAQACATICTAAAAVAVAAAVTVGIVAAAAAAAAAVVEVADTTAVEKGMVKVTPGTRRNPRRSGRRVS